MSTMPNLIGMNYLDATAALIAAGFVPGNVNEVKIRSGGNSQMGVVISQPIVAGATVTAGTVISLTVNKPFGQFPASEQNEPIPYWFFLSQTPSTPIGPVAPPVIIPSFIAGNLAAGGSSSFSGSNGPLWKNQVRSSRGFTALTNPWMAQVALDSSGWPTVGHTVLLWEGGTFPGWISSATITTPMKCGFIGTGTPTVLFNCTIGNIVNGNGNTTYTTFDLYSITGPFGFQNSAAATNVFAYPPQYAAEVIDNVTTGFTTEAIALWNPVTNVSMLRDSWFSNTPEMGVAITAATRHSLANTQANQSWSGTTNEGYPKEWAMYFCKAAGLGYWSCLATYDDGVNNSAGSYTHAVLSLISSIIIPTGKPVILELANEVWNGTPCGISGILGSRAVANGFATSTSDVTGCYQYFAYLYHQLSVMCQSVFGSNYGVGKQVQIAFCNQQGGNGISALDTAAAYILAHYGAVNADMQLFGLAPYMNLAHNGSDNSTAAVLADLSIQTGIAYTNLAETSSILALHFGMKMVMYEGQWQLNEEATNAFIKPAMTSFALSPILVTWMQKCVDNGFTNINWFEIGISGGFGTTSPYSDELTDQWPASAANSPQLVAIQTMAPGAYTSQRNVVAAIGSTTISGGNFNSMLNGTPISLESFNNFLPSFTFCVAPCQIWCLSAFSKTVVANVTGSGTVNVEVNGTMVATAVSLPGGNTTLGTFAFKAGYNYVAIGSNGFQAVTAVNSFTFS